MRHRFLLGILLTALLFAGGCWELVDINDTAVVTGIGLDRNEQGEVNFSVQLPKAKSPGQTGLSQPESIVNTSTGITSSMAARNSLLYLPRLPLWSHSSVLVVGEQLARSDLAVAADYLARSRVIRKEQTVLIAAGTTADQVLQAPLPLSPYSGKAFGMMLSLQEKQTGNYVPITLNDFLVRLSVPGIEPAVPQIVIKQETPTGSGAGPQKPGPRLALQGMAVFKGPKMAGSFNETESRGYRWMSSEVEQGGVVDIPSPVNRQENVALEVTRFSHQIRPRLIRGTPRINIEIKADLVFYEEDGTGELIREENIRKMEALAAQEISREIKACIAKSQALQSDVLGWGQSIHRYQPDLWTKIAADWPVIFPGVESQIKVKTSIKRTYLTYKSFKFR